MIKKVSLLFNTIKYLKFKQVYFRLYYLLKNKFLSNNSNIKIGKYTINHDIVWNNIVFNPQSYEGNNTFTFLNKKKMFPTINWNFSEYGKLWVYNLNYFDFLFQENITTEEAVSLILDFVKNERNLKDGIEPYPISLRGMNWVKFLSSKKIQNSKINDCLYKHYKILKKNIEYHLLGNHLLENGFSLLFAGYYFKNEQFYNLSKKILFAELNEQILKDGGHAEQSSMYHQIMLHRVLDCIALIQENNLIIEDKNLLYFLLEKAKVMLSWLSAITYKNGDIPMVNDSTYGIAPTSKILFCYAKKLNIEWTKVTLSDSGYKKIEKSDYELFLDIGDIALNYQPGHTHSDTLNFELYKNKNPIIVDRGISTYEKNFKRQAERSTSSHNTVQINECEQTQVWGGFRVGKRAKIIELIESDNSLSAIHNGYKTLGILHKRKYIYLDKEINIIDQLIGSTKENAYAYFHFHPNIRNIRIKDTFVYLDDLSITFYFDNFESLTLDRYEYCLGFNKTEEAKKLIVKFRERLETTIY